MLEQETLTWKKEKDALLVHSEGKFAIIKEDSVHRLTWDTYADALQFGYHIYGLDSFMIKQILRIEPFVRI